MKREKISNRCKSKTQTNINKDYKIVKKLSEKGLEKHPSKLSLSISEQYFFIKSCNIVNSPAPCTCECEANICSTSDVPERGMPTINIGDCSKQPPLPFTGKMSRENISLILLNK